MKFVSKIFFVGLIFCLIFSLSFSCFAAENGVYEKFLDNNGGLISVSHRGDTSLYPENSLEAIVSAKNKGADLISVSVQRSKDGVFFLVENGFLSGECKTEAASCSELSSEEIKSLLHYNLDGSVSSCRVATLKEAVDALGGEAVLIADNCFEYFDEIESFCRENNAFSKVILRTDSGSKKVFEKLSQKKTELQVISIYSGAIIWNTHLNLSRMAEASQAAVQFQSKNYFNVCYGSFTADKFSSGNNPRAVAPMFNKDLCGQREDNVSGWNELISKGFSVVETNCIEELEAYISQCESGLLKLSQLIETAKTVNTGLYSSGSEEAFTDALKKAEKVFENKNSSLGEIQQANSLLIETMKNLTFGEHKDDQRGTLNITAGKIAAVVVFGGLILAGEIYVYKKQKSKLCK